jgi:hypothetical protein
MRKTPIIVMLILGLTLTSTSAFGFVFNYYPDFGTSVFDENNNASPVTYPLIGNLPSPGPFGMGGEAFDEEGLFIAEKNGMLYGALANSFGASVYSTDWNQTYETGHLFFGFNGAYDQYCIDLGTGNLYAVGGWSPILNLPGTYYNNLTIRNKVGAYRMTQGSLIGSLSDFMMTHLTNYEGIIDGGQPLSPFGNRDTYVYEWAIDMSLFNSAKLSEPLASVKFHHTLACGNDLIEREYDFGAIPEPATLVLLGTGLIGAGMLRRRIKK